ncbi:MAG: hypothetical protein Q9Q40_03465 [Acidobacteriota bacterium]|nr:hypothetical protein [Acidobacteriota bacterium]MDQ7086721.1 hypothetical protein [Acidobacteriota bacterium]
MSTTAVKTRRFLAVPKGSYPEPLRVQVQACDPSPLSAPPAEEALSPPADEPALPVASPPVSPEAAPPAEIAVPEAGPALPEAPPVLAPDPPPAADPAPQMAAEEVRPGAARGRILVGGMAGALFGLAAGGMLLALSGGADGLEALSQPLELWNAVEDPLVKASALLVAVGFILLGAGLAGRRRGEHAARAER